MFANRRATGGAETSGGAAAQSQPRRQRGRSITRVCALTDTSISSDLSEPFATYGFPQSEQTRSSAAGLRTSARFSRPGLGVRPWPAAPACWPRGRSDPARSRRSLLRPNRALACTARLARSFASSASSSPIRVRRVSTSRRSETIVLRLRASTPAAASSRFSRPTSSRSESASRAARRTSLTSARAAVSLSRPISNCRRQNRALARQSISPRRHSSARRLSRSNSDRQSGSPDVGADGPPPSGKGGPDPSSRTGAGIIRKSCAGTDMRTKITHVERRYQTFAIGPAEMNRNNVLTRRSRENRTLTYWVRSKRTPRNLNASRCSAV